MIKARPTCPISYSCLSTTSIAKHNTNLLTRIRLAAETPCHMLWLVSCSYLLSRSNFLLNSALWNWALGTRPLLRWHLSKQAGHEEDSGSLSSVCTESLKNQSSFKPHNYCLINQTYKIYMETFKIETYRLMKFETMIQLNWWRCSSIMTVSQVHKSIKLTSADLFKAR